MTFFEERHPSDSLACEAVLHVRRHLRLKVRANEADAAAALAMLFGLDATEAQGLGLDCCLSSDDPLRAAAQVIGRARGQSVVSLAYDSGFIESCRLWLLARKRSESAFDQIIASDLRTLLELSKARDYANPFWREGGEQRVAPPILILGETGTGKELLANALHDIWRRGRSSGSALEMQVLHVAGKGLDLVSDELFGHVKGAFTGAVADRPGRLEDADKSTLLIDEVGDLSGETQVQLLRFLQDQKFSQNGTNRVKQVSVRILAATLHDLDKLVEEGRFRKDFLHRLSVCQLRLPPLRERANTFPDIVVAMLAKLGHRASYPITRTALDALAAHDWPGNLRELHGVLRAALISSNGDTVRIEDLPPHIQQRFLRKSVECRIPGILLDNLVGSVPEGVLRERVRYASAELLRERESARCKETEGTWSRFAALLQMIPDPTPEHQETIRQLQALSLNEQRQSATVDVRDYWLRVRSEPLSPALAPAITEELQGLEIEVQRMERLSESIAKKEQSLKARSPWLRLFFELEAHPIRKHVPDWGSLIQSLVTGIQFLSALVPAALPSIRNALETGGLEKLKDVVLEILATKNDPTVVETIGETIEDERDRKKPDTLTREEWQNLADRRSSLSEIQKMEGYDPKTVKRYFERYNIEPRWQNQRGQRKTPRSGVRTTSLPSLHDLTGLD